ncbi:MAG: hypothetical protein P1Q69_11930 [Candidatus Thorarchaeota archaeon]|nr:hypothetical protein [Candidatus Thorarchaeota archaeon]
MERKQRSSLIAIFGIVIFLGSMFLLLPLVEYYLLALILMFVGVIMIGIGSAMFKNFDNSLDQPAEDCYYCNGTGRIDGLDGPVTCARCGGTGVFSSDSD